MCVNTYQSLDSMHEVILERVTALPFDSVPAVQAASNGPRPKSTIRGPQGPAQLPANSQCMAVRSPDRRCEKAECGTLFISKAGLLSVTATIGAHQLRQLTRPVLRALAVVFNADLRLSECDHVGRPGIVALIVLTDDDGKS